MLGQPDYAKEGRRGDVMIVDDYGHHPAEVEATLDAAQRGFDRRVVVAFQPHRYTRTKLLFDEFTRAFNKADVLLVTDVYPAGEKPIAGASGEELAEAIRAHGHHAVALRARQEERRPRRSPRSSSPGDIVIALGAGDINASARELPTRSAAAAVPHERVSQASPPVGAAALVVVARRAAEERRAVRLASAVESPPRARKIRPDVLEAARRIPDDDAPVGPAAPRRTLGASSRRRRLLRRRASWVAPRARHVMRGCVGRAALRHGEPAVRRQRDRRER